MVKQLPSFKYTWEVVVKVSNLVLRQLIADGKLTEAPKVEAAPLKRIRQKRPPLTAEELGDGGPRIVQEDDLWFHPPGMPGWRAVRHDLPRTRLYVPDGRTGPAPTTLSRRRWTYYVKYPVTDPQWRELTVPSDWMGVHFPSSGWARPISGRSLTPTKNETSSTSGNRRSCETC